MFRVKTLAVGLSWPLRPRIHHAIATRCCSNVAGGGSDSKRSMSTAATAQAARAEPFLNGTSSNYTEAMYSAWQQDPNSVHKSWQALFEGKSYQRASPGAAITPTVFSPAQEDVRQNAQVKDMIAAFQNYGHRVAKLDPLETYDADLDSSMPKELTTDHYNIDKEDLNKEFLLSNTYIGGGKEKLPLQEIINNLEKVYCYHIGLEYHHINNAEQIDWIRKKFEPPGSLDITVEEKHVILARLIRSQRFEDFLSKKFPSEKRFGLEGCEVLIPGLKAMIDQSTERGVDSFIIGMPHRGRLNVLANVCRMDLEKIFIEFESPASGEIKDESSGDVKYHLGMFQSRLNRLTNKQINLSVVANPSHLEAVNPVVQGKTRAEQDQRGDNGKTVMSVLLHGDAAFSGQGVVFETNHLSKLKNYTTQGCIHVVVNNQIGFTTVPEKSRSSPYCTDVAKVTGSPVFHVNADDPEAVVYAFKMAAEWRADFHSDIVIDLVCYRRNGHNEIDEPMITQPGMYKKIGSQKKVTSKYADKLIEEGAVTNDAFKEEISKYDEILESAMASMKSNMLEYKNKKNWLDSPWEASFFARDWKVKTPTHVDENILLDIGEKTHTFPQDFKLHKALQRTMRIRKELLKKREVDWALAEIFTFGSLLMEKNAVRISGQDSERGTFNHRHAVMHHQEEEKTYTPLKHLAPDQGDFTVCNSSLSEYGVMGFELGYSLSNPYVLVIWEAQFGDFANTAQPIIDQFLSSGEAKWTRQSGLVLFLPHGYEGMGPEHSSARLERFLQMSSDDPETWPKIDDENFEMQQLRDVNWFVCNVSTPANMFHVLRRQMLLPFRKPLIMMTPKSPLRDSDTFSKLEEFTEGSQFQRMYPEAGPASENREHVRRLIFCSGKVYYALNKERAVKENTEKIAIARVESLTPFPYDLVKAEIEKYPRAEIVWAQEEHKNMGSWSYVEPRIRNLMDSMNLEKKVKYMGLPTAAATATGSKYSHTKDYGKYVYESVKLEYSK